MTFLARRLALLICATVLFGATAACAFGAVSPSPAWELRTLALPTHLSSTSGGDVVLIAHNRGALATDGSTVTVTDTLPAGLTSTAPEGNPAASIKMEDHVLGNVERATCSVAGQMVTCAYAHALSGLDVGRVVVDIHVSVTPGTLGSLVNRATISGGGAPEAGSEGPVLVSPEAPLFGLADFSTATLDAAGSLDTQAGAHPSAISTTFDLNSSTEGPVHPGSVFGGQVEGVQNMRDVVVDLPPGFVGDAEATPKCPLADLAGAEFSCPPDTFIGTVTAFGSNGNRPGEFSGNFLVSETSRKGGWAPIVNVQPEHGYPAEFALELIGVPATLYAKLVPTPSGYALRVISSGISRGTIVNGLELTFFGDPPGQDPFGVAPGGTPVSFFTNPTDCSQSGFTTTMHVDSWQNPAAVPLNPDGSPDFNRVNFSEPQWANATAVSPPVTGCEKLQFAPSLSVRPESSAVDSPTGLQVDIHIPQNTEPAGLASGELRNAVVTLPAGMVVNPSVANGLSACSPAQIDLAGAEPPACPESAKVGTVEVDTPILDHALQGSVYVAEQGNNPFGSLLALYVVVDDPQTGIVVKLAGHVIPDPQTGRLTTVFENNPQQPLSDIKLDFFGGPRAALVNPDTCGSYAASSQLTPWSSSTASEPTGAFAINQGCHGALFTPGFVAGTTSNQAGAFSPFTLSLSRGDQEQDLGGVSVTMPQGLLGSLKSVERCPEPQAAQGTCGAGSVIGHATATAGAGPDPVSVSGQVFLTGPYKGAPFGLSIVVPAVAGPFNLGNVVVRAAISVDPRTAQIIVTSDSLPTILQGIPLQVKGVRVSIDRQAFMFNPTDCEPLNVGGTLTSTLGAQARVSSRFQAANCASLAFHPVFSVSTQARTSKKGGASLDVKVVYPQGPQANIRSVAVTLPKQLPSRLSTIQQACTEAAFAANPASCPAGSDIGIATARTPVLASPLTGPAYLVSHGGAAFPDVVVILQGEGVTLDLVGSVNIRKSITSSTFASVPDAPIGSFELSLPEGPHSALAAVLPARAKGSLCGQKLTMPTTITGQNGAVVKQSTKIAVSGCAKARKAKKHRARKRAKRGGK
ncbi:MAG TPA: hypothetical protein VGY76_03735 [Solirubrobacteraceae bacterium]|jgi:hypothetical protein|nr:hypothetical protein [Solirubrobacteraceae bacterium]